MTEGRADDPFHDCELDPDAVLGTRTFEDVLFTNDTEALTDASRRGAGHRGRGRDFAGRSEPTCGLLVTLIYLLEGAGEQVAETDGTFRIGTGDVLAVPREGEHEDHHTELDDVIDDDGEEEAREVVLAREQDGELPGNGNGRGDALTEPHRDGVTAVDVREFASDDALEFVAVEQLDEFREMTTVPLPRRRPRARLARHVGDLQRRRLHILIAANLLYELVDLRVSALGSSSAPALRKAAYFPIVYGMPTRGRLPTMANGRTPWPNTTIAAATATR